MLYTKVTTTYSILDYNYHAVHKGNVIGNFLKCEPSQLVKGETLILFKSMKNVKLSIQNYLQNPRSRESQGLLNKGNSEWKI